jgi:hypothetical protein
MAPQQHRTTTRARFRVHVGITLLSDADKVADAKLSPCLYVYMNGIGQYRGIGNGIGVQGYRVSDTFM